MNFLNLEHKNWIEEKSWQVRLDHIGNQKYYVKESNKPKILTVTIFYLFILVCTSIYLFSNKHTQNESITIIVCDLVIGLIGLSLILKKGKNIVIITGGDENITFYNDSKNAKELNEFIDHVINCANNYILEKYGKIDPDLPEESQLNIFRWLRDRELIDDNEYENLKKEYKMSKLI
jgi:hypothetical protein